MYIGQMHFALPNTLWKKLSECCLFVFLQNALLFDRALERYGAVNRRDSSSMRPIALFNRSSTSCHSGFPWSGTNATSYLVRLASCSFAVSECKLSSSRSKQSRVVNYNR